MYYAECPCITDGAGKFCIADPEDKNQSRQSCAVTTKSTIAFPLGLQGLEEDQLVLFVSSDKNSLLIPSCLVNCVLKGMMIDSSRAMVRMTN